MADSAGDRFDRLIEVMRTLRGPNGCPWDREQTLASLRPFVLEETYELIEALDRGDVPALKEELGDFLFEAVFLAQLCEEQGHFGIGDAVQGIADKLVRRHPHVFRPDGQPLAQTTATPDDDASEDHPGAPAPAFLPVAPMTAADVIERWEALKSRERKEAGRQETTILGGIPRTLPALLRAYELGARAAAVGFDWPQTTDVLDKMEEELAELKEALATEAQEPARIEEEMGDLFFALANLSRKLGVEPEAALRQANQKFQRRFEGMERLATSEGRELSELQLGELEAYWEAQKRATKSTKNTKQE